VRVAGGAPVGVAGRARCGRSRGGRRGRDRLRRPFVGRDGAKAPRSCCAGCRGSCRGRLAALGRREATPPAPRGAAHRPVGRRTFRLRRQPAAAAGRMSGAARCLPGGRPGRRRSGRGPAMDRWTAFFAGEGKVRSPRRPPGRGHGHGACSTDPTEVGGHGAAAPA